MKRTGKFAAAIISGIMMVNGLCLPMAYAAPASRYVNVDEKYDPFAEEEEPVKEVDTSKLTFKERMALQAKQEQAATQKVAITNVLIFLSKRCLMLSLSKQQIPKRIRKINRLNSELPKI